MAFRPRDRVQPPNLPTFNLGQRPRDRVQPSTFNLQPPTSQPWPFGHAIAFNLLYHKITSIM
ncbi:MAG: hypothetical protein F6J98_24875 [Moorea sp. SIO4G2]|nr:hypothetical protein [Moorena sp. SIO4G2]